MTDDFAQDSHVDEENYFISMTDLMVGLVFIFVLLLMYFALQFRQTSDRLTRTTDELTSANRTRTAILEQVQRYLKEKGVRVEIDVRNGVLRLPDEILFDSGQADLKPEGQAALRNLSDGLMQVLPCYSEGVIKASGCPSSTHKVEAIFIEGHTDRDPLKPSVRLHDNWDLSVARATTTYRDMIQFRSELALLCERSEPHACTPIFGVSGYGDSRPIDLGAAPSAKAKNRRIDIRILMASPKASDVSRMERDVGVR
jgi:flagellar motor protein MotB